MSWWKRPLRLTLTVRMGGTTRRLSTQELLFAGASLLILLVLSTALLFAYLGMRAVEDQADKRVRTAQQRLERIRAENRRLHKRQQRFAAIQSTLRTIHRQHREILRLAGVFPQPSAAEHRGANSGPIASVSPRRQLRSLTRWEERLDRVKNYLRKRNRVLQSTPTLWPTNGWVSSPYGYRKDPMGGSGRSLHEGVDIAAWQGSPVRAPAKGRVSYAGWKSGYGNTVRIEHQYGYETLYGHMSKILVEEGTQVEKGQIIGRVGNTGHSTGSHVHYEVRVNDHPLDPLPYLVEEYNTFKRFRPQVLSRSSTP